MSSIQLAHTRITIMTRKALVLTTLAGLGLSACSTQQMVQSSAESVSTIASTSASTTNTQAVAPAPVVVVSATAAPQQMASADYAANPSMLIRAVPQSKIVRPSPFIVAESQSGDNYQDIKPNLVHKTSEMAVATLSIDTDTGSYANVRRYLNEGRLPPVDAVRAEELINYFNYQFADGKRVAGAPFMVATEVVDSPWDRADQGNKIVKVAIKAVDTSLATASNTNLPPANLVFLVDVSGSMSSNDKLPLAQASLKLLTQQLRAQDSVSIVTYSGSTSVALPATSGDKKSKIIAAIDSLTAAGSTNGEDALMLAYNQAEQAMQKKGINRIVMLTDGDFNVGISDVNEMLDLVKANRDRGISLSTLGFGRGNLNDYMMEQMANSGNGNYSYIDSLTEAKKVFTDELGATFNTVAKDVKIQLEFNPAVVSEWRLIGYENRVLNEQDFNNDKVDAGELGAGKAVVALFEVTPTGQVGLYSERRYASDKRDKTVATTQQANELGLLKIRYKSPEGGSSKLISQAIINNNRDLSNANIDTQFAIAVAGFAQRLAQSDYINEWSFRDSGKLASKSITSQPSSDTDGIRRNFVILTELADALKNHN